MSPDVEDDLRAFVVARWAELEAVARVVVLDPVLARSVTADALAGLCARWQDAVEEGRPGEDARRALLIAALAGVPSPGGWRTRPPCPTRGGRDPAPLDGPVVASANAWEDEEPDVGVVAVLAELAASDPLDRALVGARVVWEMRSHEVAHLLGRPHGELAGRQAALDGRLDAARSRARMRAGPEPGHGWQDRVRDVGHAVDVLVRGEDDPPDPAALVTERSGRLRRRHLVLGGLAAVTVTGLGAAVAAGGGPGGSRRAATPSTPPGPDDPSWARTSTWAARGPLGNDPDTRVLIASTGLVDGRVLWGGDLGTRRVVVIRQLALGDVDGTSVALFAGARGQAVRSLQRQDLTLPGSGELPDLVAVALPDGAVDAPSTLLVVLARPSEESVSVSQVAAPMADGRVERRHTDIRLRDGLGLAVLDGPLGAALRVRARDTDVTPAIALVPVDEREAGTTDADSLPTRARRLASVLTGFAEDRLRTEVVVDERLDASAVAPTASGVSRVVVVHTTTPDGGVLASVAAVDETGTASGGVLLRSAVILPEGKRGDPVVERISDERPGLGRYLVVAPGAARIQLIAASPDGYPVSKVVRTEGRDAVVVAMVNADTASTIRVVARDAEGRTLFDAVPIDPRPLARA